MLPRSGFLTDASPELTAMLAALSTEVRLNRGQVLFEEGDEGDALFAVVDGALEMSVMSEDGRRFALDVVRGGEIFGEIALFDPGVRTATATATERSRLQQIRNAELVREMRRTPELGIAMIRLCGQRMRLMNRQLSEQVFHPMPARLAGKVLHLAAAGNVPGTLEMSQAQLAEHVGTTREAVSRTLAEWKRRGVISVSRGGIRVLDETALEDLAEPEPR